MRVLVTGGSGYIGCILVPTLWQQGFKVRVLDTRAFPGATPTIIGDARDMRAVEPLLTWPDVIIPLAGLVGAPACSEDEYGAVTTNRYAIQDLMSRLSKNQRVVFPATDSGYPSGDVNEESPMDPQSVYAKTKRAAELVVLEEGHTSLRLASVFGRSPAMRRDLIVNNFVWHAVTKKPLDIYEGDYRRNFVHVSDVARAFGHAIRNHLTGAYNVGNSSCAMTKRLLATKIAQHIPNFVWRDVEGGASDPDRRDNVVSNDKLEATEWEPKIGIDFGINELREAYQEIIYD